MYTKWFVKSVILLAALISTAYAADKWNMWIGLLIGFVIAYPIEALILKLVKKAEQKI